MSVLIKGMKMPKGCSFCKMKEQNRHGQCSITGTEWESDTKILLNFDSSKERLWDCPLIELPNNHGRLIDAEAFFDRFLSVDRTVSFGASGLYVDIHDLYKILSRLPTVIEAEGE